jgi:hypothetical protein
MATYREIQAYVENLYGFVPHTCWIAEVKELCHIPHLREAANRIGKEREKINRCPKKNWLHQRSPKTIRNYLAYRLTTAFAGTLRLVLL